MLVRWCTYTVLLLMDFSDFSFISSVCARSLQSIYSKSHKLINQLSCRSLEVSVRELLFSTWPISNTQVADTYVKLLLETGHWARYNFVVTQCRISDVSMNSWVQMKCAPALKDLYGRKYCSFACCVIWVIFLYLSLLLEVLPPDFACSLDNWAVFSKRWSSVGKKLVSIGVRGET